MKYVRKFLLTKNEYKFFKDLKIIADDLNLTVLSKIRMADLVEPCSDAVFEYQKLFAKIKAKHVDFALADPENLYIKLLIELDDSTHDQEDRIKRDEFVEEVYKDTGYKLVRLRRDSSNIRKEILEALGSEYAEYCVFEARQVITVKDGTIYRNEKYRTLTSSASSSVPYESLSWFNKLKISFSVKRRWGSGISLKWNK